MAEAPKPHHEVDRVTGLHRIVCGQCYGEWVKYNQVAQLGVYRACSMYFAGVLPVQTVFTTKDVDLQDTKIEAAKVTATIKLKF